MLRICSALTAGTLLLGVRLLDAQTLPGGDSVMNRIWSIGMDSSRLPVLANQLLDSIGPRLTGSPGQKNGNQWLVQTYKSWGIEATNEPYGTWRGWRRGIATISLVSPRVRVLDATLLPWSPGTGGKDVTAGTIILPRFRDSTEFAAWLPQAAGKYVLISAPQPTCRPSSDWDTFATPASKRSMDSLLAANEREWNARILGAGFSLGISGFTRLGRRLDAAHVAGVVSSQPKGNAGATRVDGMIDNETAPAVSLSCEDYGLVYRLTENNMHPQLRVTADAELLGEVPVFNTIARIPGGEKPNEYVMLSAHFDSFDGASGAIDNGTGTLMMMEAMRILSLVYPHPKRTILVGHWSGEEQLMVGSRAWSEDHPEVIAGMQAVFNQDDGTGRVRWINGGGSGGGIGGGLVGINEHLQAWRAQLPSVFTDSIRFEADSNPPFGPSMDGAVFACKGAPSFGLWSREVNWSYRDASHTNRDSYDKVVFDDLKYNATLVAMLAYQASEDSTLISRVRSEGAWPNCGVAPRTTRIR